jgi:hypothetical protein
MGSWQRSPPSWQSRAGSWPRPARAWQERAGSWPSAARRRAAVPAPCSPAPRSHPPLIARQRASDACAQPKGAVGNDRPKIRREFAGSWCYRAIAKFVMKPREVQARDQVAANVGRELIEVEVDGMIAAARQGAVVIDSNVASLTQLAAYECAATLGGEAALTYLPPTADRVPYALLSLAAQCGRSRVVAEAIEHARIEDACDLLEDALQNRVIVAVGEPLAHDDRFGVPAISKTERDIVDSWLGQRPSIRTVSSTIGGASAPTHELDVQASSLADVVRQRWIQAKRDVFAFKLLCAHAEIGEEPSAWAASDLAEGLWNLLPQRLQTLVTALSVQARPAPRSVIEAAIQPGPTLLAQARKLGIVRFIAEASAQPLLVLDDDFAKWLLSGSRQRLLRSELDDVHLQLARAFEHAFVQAKEPSYSLEAQQHYGSAGRFEDVQRFSAIGARALIDAGRSLSRQQSYEEAARAYQCALALNEGSAVLSSEARGYAKHYTHYNRYKAQSESLRETRDGYQTSLDDWGDNALFWSRFVRAEALCGALPAAREAQRRAFDQVPPHSAREQFLVDRVVDRLLARECWVEAAALASSNRTTNELDFLVESLGRPRLVRRLIDKRFSIATLFAMRRVNRRFECAVPGYQGTDDTPARALDALEAALPAEPGRIDAFDSAAPRMLDIVTKPASSLSLADVLWLREAERREATLLPVETVRALLDAQATLPSLVAQRNEDNAVCDALHELRAAGLCARRSNAEALLILGGRSQDTVDEIETFSAPFSIRSEPGGLRVRVTVERQLVERYASDLREAVQIVSSHYVPHDGR